MGAKSGSVELMFIFSRPKSVYSIHAVSDKSLSHQSFGMDTQRLGWRRQHKKP